MIAGQVGEHAGRERHAVDAAQRQRVRRHFHRAGAAARDRPSRAAAPAPPAPRASCASPPAPRRRCGSRPCRARRSGCSAASKIDATRYAVVVLPLVPVMPTTCISRARMPVERRREHREREPRVVDHRPRRPARRPAPAARRRRRRRRARSPAARTRRRRRAAPSARRTRRRARPSASRRRCRSRRSTAASARMASSLRTSPSRWSTPCSSAQVMAASRRPRLRVGAARARSRQTSPPFEAARPAAGSCDDDDAVARSGAPTARACTSVRIASRALRPRRSGIVPGGRRRTTSADDRRAACRSRSATRAGSLRARRAPAARD